MTKRVHVKWMFEGEEQEETVHLVDGDTELSFNDDAVMDEHGLTLTVDFLINRTLEQGRNVVFFEDDDGLFELQAEWIISIEEVE